MSVKTNLRRVALALFLPFMLLLSSCVNVDAHFIINKDETVDFTVTILDPQNNLTDPMTASEDRGRCDAIVGDSENFTESGTIAASPVSKDGVAGCKIEATGFSVDEVNNLGYGEILHAEGKYQVNADGFRGIIGDKGNEGTLSITFPGKVEESSGGELSNDDKTITWNSPRSENTMSAQAGDGDSASLIFLISVIIPIFIIFMGMGYHNSKKSKKSEKDPPPADNNSELDSYPERDTLPDEEIQKSD